MNSTPTDPGDAADDPADRDAALPPLPRRVPGAETMPGKPPRRPGDRVDDDTLARLLSSLHDI